MTTSPPLRILHAVCSMKRAGTETWLMHVLRGIDRRQYAFDFLVDITEECAYDREIRALGSRIIPCQSPSRPWEYAKNFRRIMRDYGPYDIVHSHVHHFSGFILRLAAASGVPVRIAHSHTDTRPTDASASFARRCYLRLMKHWIARYATHGLAASEKAALALFGPSWADDPCWRLLFCGIDLSPFELAPAPDSRLREAFSFAPDHLVVGHVGRFEEMKNHDFLLDVFAKASRCQPSLRLLLMGDGSLRPAMENKAQRLGITELVTFTGNVTEVPQMLREVVDLFIFPSQFEGLGLALVEAQAANLPCLISDSIPTEADIIPGSIRRLPLAAGPQAWADALTTMAASCTATGMMPAEALACVQASPFNIRHSIDSLVDFYGEASRTIR